MNRLFPLLILLSPFLAAQAIPTPADAPAAPLPVAVVPIETHDAGNVLKGTKIVHAFTITNTGKAELAILSAKAG